MYKTLVAATLALLIALPVHADEKLVEAPFGQTASVTVAPNAGTTKINFAYLSKGNDPLMLRMSVGAPGKANISVKSVGVKAKSVSDAFNSIKSAYTLNIAPSGGTFKSSFTIGDTSSSGNNNTGSDAKMCNGNLLVLFKDYFITVFAAQNNGKKPADDNELCTYFFPDYASNPGSSSGGTTVTTPNGPTTTLNARLIKDSCSSSSEFSYLVVASVDLTRISADAIATGFTVDFSFDQESFYQGGQATSLKPSSDGKYKGQALVFTQAIGNDHHLYARFSSGAVKTLKSLTPKKIAKSFFYNGSIFVASLPGSLLSGGKGDICDSDESTNVYCTCLSLTKIRQNLKGYPNK